MDMEKVIKGLNDIGGFIAGRIGFEQARNFMRTLDDTVALLKEQKKPNGKCVNECECWDSAYERGKQDALKEQEAVVKQWTKEIADNQLAHAPNDSPMSLDEQLECEYKRGIWDGLEIAWNIISEGR